MVRLANQIVNIPPEAQPSHSSSFDPSLRAVTTTPNLPQYPPDASTVIPTVQVDLDEPAEQRWVKALAPRKAEIARLVYAVIVRSSQLSAHHIHPHKHPNTDPSYPALPTLSHWQDQLPFSRAGPASLLPAQDQLPFSRINSTVIRLLLAAGAEKEMARFPPDYAAEIRGVAAATGVPLGFIFVLNVAYELIGLCTSIVAQDAAGNVWHGRNLDFGIFMGTDPQHHTWALTQPLRDALVNVEFRRGGRPLFNATTYAGFVGVHSGMRSGAFSLTIDTRYDDSVDAGLIEFLLGKSGGREFIAFATRRALETNATYAAALDALTMYRPMGPGYIILGGANSGEGAVITKQFSGKDAKPPTKDVWKLSEVLANGSFYLAQTNYDRTGPPPAFDDRRYPVQNCLDDGGQASVTKAGLFQIMSANPTRNALTTFTTLMSAGLGVFEAYTQRCDPSPHCAPF